MPSLYDKEISLGGEVKMIMNKLYYAKTIERTRR